LSPLGVAELITSCLTVIAALIVAEARNLVRAAFAFLAFSVLIAALFWMLSAPYVAVFQLTIYAGLITVLVFVTLGLTKGGESGEG